MCVDIDNNIAATEDRLTARVLTMPNGDRLECDYPDSPEWAKSWSIRYAATGQVGTTQEQDWEVVETYGLTAILNAALATRTPVAATEGGLLPCPFCGCDRLAQSFTRATDECAFWSVECTECGVAVTDDESQAAADEHWNTRTPSPCSLGQEPLRDPVQDFGPDDFDRDKL